MCVYVSTSEAIKTSSVIWTLCIIPVGSQLQFMDLVDKMQGHDPSDKMCPQLQAKKT